MWIDFRIEEMRNLINIQILRVAATILVVLFHALGCYTYGWGFCSNKIMAYEIFDVFINQINMPLFVAISGYLYGYSLKQGKYGNTFNFISKKARHLLVPYIVWTIFQLIIFPETTHIFMIYKGCLHLWFILMLFALFVGFSISRKLWASLNVQWAIVVLLTLLVVPLRFRLINVLGIQSAWSMAVYFMGGILISRTDTKKRGDYNLMLLFAGVATLLVSCILHDRQVDIYESLLRRVSCLSIVTMLLTINFNTHKKYEEWGGQKIIAILDRNSMGIYIIHHIILWCFVQQPMFKQLIEDHYILMPIFMFFVAMSGALFLSYLINNSKFKIVLG